MTEDPRLYAIAKQITLDAGFPYTDPRTLETTQPGEKQMKKNNKIPKWILLDQWHLDLEILSNVPPAERKRLRTSFNSIIRSFLHTDRQKNYRIKVTQ